MDANEVWNDQYQVLNTHSSAPGPEITYSLISTILNNQIRVQAQSGFPCCTL